MRKHYKARLVKFCPLCGSDVVTHLGHNSFVCGTGDPEEEAKGKLAHTNSRCNRVFGIVQPVHCLEDNGRHRKEIGSLINSARCREETHE